MGNVGANRGAGYDWDIAIMGLGLRLQALSMNCSALGVGAYSSWFC